MKAKMSGKFAIVLLLAVALLAGCFKDPAKQKADYLASAEKYVASEQYGEAIIQYRNALKLTPTDAKTQFKLGDAYFKNGQLREAFLSYRKAGELDPNMSAAKLAVAKFYLVTQQFQEALQVTSEVLKKEPDNVDAILTQASAFAGKKDIPQSIKILNDLIEKHPDLTVARMHLGIFLVAQGKKEEAKAVFEKAIALDPKAVDAYKSLASYYLSNGNAAKAEELVKAGVAANPSSLEAHQVLAEFLVSRGRFAEAEPEFKQVVTLDKNSLRSRTALASFYLTAQRPEDAKNVFRQMIADKPEYKPARYELAEILFRQGKVEEASAVVDDILKLNPKDAGGLVLRARVELEHKEPQKAIPDLEAAQKSDPNIPMVQYMFGIAYMQLGNSERAQNSFEQALAINPEFTKAQLALGEMMQNRGQFDAALKYAEQVLAPNREPNNPAALLLAASAQAAKGSTVEAKARLDKFMQLAPNSPEGPMRLGLVALKDKKYDQALTYFEKALQMDPDNQQAINGEVAAYMAQNKNDKAIERVKSQIAKKETGPLYYSLGKIYFAMKKMPEAEAALKKSLELAPSNSEVMVMLGTLYAQGGNLDKALAQYQAATAAKPKDANLWTVYGMLQDSAGKPADARKSWEKALSVNPNAGLAANNLAWVLSEDGQDMDRALELARQAKVSLPQNASVNDTLGWIYCKRRLFDSAVPLLQEAVRMQPENAAYHVHLAAALAGAGKKEQAKAELQKASKDAEAMKRPDLKRIVDSLNL